MCDEVAQQPNSEKIRKYIGFYGPCAARQNEAGGSMGLALWVLPGAATSQMQRGKHNNKARNERSANLVGRRAEGGSFVRRGVLTYLFSTRCTAEVIGMGATDTYI